MNIEMGGKVTEIPITEIVQLFQKGRNKLLIDYYVSSKTHSEQKQKTSGRGTRKRAYLKDRHQV